MHHLSSPMSGYYPELHSMTSQVETKTDIIMLEDNFILSVHDVVFHVQWPQ